MAKYYDEPSSKDGSYPYSRIVMYKERPSTGEYFKLNNFTMKYNEQIDYFVSLGYGYYYSGTYSHLYYSPRNLNYKISSTAIGPVTDPRDCPVPAKWQGKFDTTRGGLQCYTGFTYSFKYESGYCWYKRNDDSDWSKLCYANGFWILLIGGGGGGREYYTSWWNKYGGGGGGGGGAVIGFVNLRAMSALQKIWYLSVGDGGASGNTGGPTFFANTATYASIKYGLVAGGGHGATSDVGGEGGSYQSSSMYDSNFSYFFYTHTQKGNTGGQGAKNSGNGGTYTKINTGQTFTSRWATLTLNNESANISAPSGSPGGGYGAPAPGAGSSYWGHGGYGGNSGSSRNYLSGHAGTAFILPDNNTGE